MPRKCTVCQNLQREAIDKALVSCESIRDIAGRFEISRAALDRHKKSHLPERLQLANQAEGERQAVNVLTELQACLDRIRRLADACDAWLDDPDVPGQYDIGPRAGDVSVIFTEPGPMGKRIRRKARLSSLIEQVEKKGDRQVVLLETKHADPRELILKAIAGQKELLSMFIAAYDVQEMLQLLEDLEEKVNAKSN